MNLFLPEDVITQLLYAITDPQTLRMCILVCRTWKSIVLKYPPHCRTLVWENMANPKKKKVIHQSHWNEVTELFPQLKKHGVEIGSLKIDSEAKYAYFALWDAPVIMKLLLSENGEKTESRNVHGGFCLVPSINPSTIVHTIKSKGTKIKNSIFGMYGSFFPYLYKLDPHDLPECSSLELVHPKPIWQDTTSPPMQYFGSFWDIFSPDKIVLSHHTVCGLLDVPTGTISRPNKYKGTARECSVCNNGALFLGLKQEDERSHFVMLWDFRENSTQEIMNTKHHQLGQVSYVSLTKNSTNDNEFALAHDVFVSIWDTRKPSQPVCKWNRGGRQHQLQTLIWNSTGIFISQCDSPRGVHCLDVQGGVIKNVVYHSTTERIYHIDATETGIIVCTQQCDPRHWVETVDWRVKL